jgi:hypothetical protein
VLNVESERDGVLGRGLRAGEIVERYMMLKSTVGATYSQCQDSIRLDMYKEARIKYFVACTTETRPSIGEGRGVFISCITWAA